MKKVLANIGWFVVVCLAVCTVVTFLFGIASA
jgi:hypothetical protein